MAFDGEDNSLEMIVLASATYAIFKLKGPATAAVWGSFHSAKKRCEMIDQPSVEVYPLGNHQADESVDSNKGGSIDASGQVFGRLWCRES